MLRLTLLILTVITASLITSTIQSENVMVRHEISRDTVVAWLRHQEQLAETMYCEFTTVESPTDPSVIPKISEIQKVRDGSGSFVTTPERAVLNGRTTRWWRKDVGERFEVRRSNPRYEESVMVHDGQEVRQFDGFDSEGFGSIESSDRWNTVNRLNGFSVWNLYNVPHSELIQRSPKVSIDVDENGEKWRVAFQMPESEQMRVVLDFDAERRLRERQIFTKLPGDVDQRLYEMHEFRDYQDFPHPSGETIHFPSRVIERLFLGYSADGPLAEYKTRTIEFTEVQFNIPIPEEKFQLKFPTGTRVFDARAGSEWIEGTGPEVGWNARWRLLIAVNILLAVVVAVWWSLARRKHAAG